MKRRSLEDLKARQREDAEALAVDPDAHAGELTAGQRWRVFRVWFSRGIDAWTPRLERLGRWLMALGAVGGMAWRAVVFYKTRGVSPAEQQRTGIASTTMDRVEKPKDP